MYEFELFTDNLDIYHAVRDKILSYGFNCTININSVKGYMSLLTDATPSILDKICDGVVDFAEVVEFDELPYDHSDVYTQVW